MSLHLETRTKDIEDSDPQTAAPHPEEMKFTIGVRLGDTFGLKGTARATPAGMVAGALLVSSILIPMAWLARERWRLRR